MGIQGLKGIRGDGSRKWVGAWGSACAWVLERAQFAPLESIERGIEGARGLLMGPCGTGVGLAESFPAAVLI